MDFETQNELRQWLSPNEKLLWTGRPKTGIRFRPSDAFMIPFSLLWCGFAIFWESSVLLIGSAPFFFMLWGIPFVLVGLYMVIGRFIADAWRRKKTIYGITDDRIVIVSGIFSSSVKSLQIRTISDISFTQKADGSGTIMLGPSDGRVAFTGFGSGYNRGRPQTPALEFIDDVRKVYDILIAAQKN